jgi:ATP/maltotriose-dependent transcriptional regulator MalT
MYLLGDWDEAETIRRDRQGFSRWADLLLLEVVRIDVERGDLDEAGRRLDELRDGAGDDPLYRAACAAIDARILGGRGRHADALAAVREGLRLLPGVSPTDRMVKLMRITELEAALALGDLGMAEELLAGLDALDPGERTPLLEGNVQRLRARAEAARGRHEGVADAFDRAASVFDEHEMVFLLAVTRLEHAEWLASQGRDDEAAPLFDLARDTFTTLRAAPWIARARAVATSP